MFARSDDGLFQPGQPGKRIEMEFRDEDVDKDRVVHAYITLVR